MPLSPTEWTTLTDVVRRAARDRILPRFRNLDAADVAVKSGPADLVTLADTEAEADMTAALRAAWPDALVVGEEAVAAEPGLRGRIGSAARCVILDPVDGTWNFAKGLTLFGMIVAVAQAGRPVAGLLYDPVMDDWIMADDESAARLVRADGRSQVLRASTQAEVDQFVGYLPTGLIAADLRAEAAARTADMGRVSSLRCACHEYRMLAQGHADFALSGPQPHAWDHAAGALIVERAGGVARMLDGTAYDAGVTDGHLLVAGSQATWDIVAARLGFLLT